MMRETDSGGKGASPVESGNEHEPITRHKASSDLELDVPEGNPSPASSLRPESFPNLEGIHIPRGRLNTEGGSEGQI